MKMIKKIIVLVCAFLHLPIAAQSTPAATESLRIGVLPNVSARTIATNYQPMAEYLQNGLKKKIDITSGANFADFHQRAMNREFDIMITAPNLGRVAQVDGSWTPLAIFQPGVPGLLVGLNGRDNTLGLLKGKKLALANPQSLVVLAGLDWLKQQGLQAGVDFEVLRIANDDSLGVALRSNEAPFAMMSMGEFNSKHPDLKSSLTIVTKFVDLPGFLLMASPRLSDKDRQVIQQLMDQFADTEQGKRFLALNSFKGIGKPTQEQFLFLDQYVDVTRKGLSGTK